ncbi:MAG: LCP family protein [Candidatus Berkelbacteria bacterium]
MVYRNKRNVSDLVKTKSKTIWWIVFAVVVLIVGVGSWLGYDIFHSIKNITSDSKKNSLLSLFDGKTIKGQSEGRTNILLLGNGGLNHPGGGLTDTMMVLSINWQEKKMAMISVPRDLWVKVPNYHYSKINEAFFAGNQNPKISGGGGKVASTVISEVLGIPIHYYVSLDFDGFRKTVDALGGVDIYVDKALYDPYYPAANMVDYDPFKITVGLHHMDGATALKYARSRETTSDFDRARRQQQVLTAVKEKIFSLETLSNIKKITELLNILGTHIRTNMSVNEIMTLWSGIKTIDTANMTNKVFDTAPGSVLVALQDERGYIILPKKGIDNYSDMQKIAQNIFVPEVTLAPVLKIQVLNSTGKAGIATEASQLLKTYNYSVSSVGNSATGSIPSTIVYNCTGTTGESTAISIAKILQATVKTKTSCTNYDIQVILGQDRVLDQRSTSSL